VEEVPAKFTMNRKVAGPWLNALGRRLWAESEKATAAHDLRGRHVMTLILLSEQGALPQSELVTGLDMDPTTVVGLLNELERDGLVQRRRSTEDRRRHTVALTPKGAKKLADFEAILVEVEKRVLSNLTEAQRMTLHDLLRTALGE
jgi:DNA-binding MarR family transcriptional regulator